MPQMDSKKIARVHFDELQSFLSSHLVKEAPGSRASAREKLTRLTRQQFQELSTDVYDELIRRNTNSATPHLPNREDFHPKRNQARQKLSTLPKPRFKDLASDVYYELGRRYPEFKEPELLPDTPESSYEEFSGKQDVGKNDRNQPNQSAPNGRPSQENYRPGAQQPRGPERRPTPEQQYGRRSEENRPFGRAPSQVSRGDDGESMYSGARRRPSNETDGQFARKPIEPLPPGPSSATAGMVIPNKSTIVEEEIQVPYGRDDSDSRPRDSDIRDSVVTDVSGGADLGKPSNALSALASAATPKWDISPNTPQLQGGLSALAAGFDKRNESALSDDDEVKTDFFENSTIGGRARSASGGSTGRGVPASRGGLDREETEKMRKDYEYRITSLQNKVASLQDEIDNGARSKKDDEERIRELTNEISSMRSKHSEQAEALREAEELLADERSAKERAEQQREQTHQQEIRRLQQRMQDLEAEKNNTQAFGESTSIIEDLQAGMEAVLEEIKDLATRNEELLSSKNADLATIQDLEEQVADYRKKYERAKTELRGLKATSQLFLQNLQKPKSDDHLPTSSTGAIQDVHVTAFQSAADNLLTAGRSDSPSRVLSPMKAVVDAVSAIIEDARSYDLRQRSPEDTPVDYATLESLCDRAQATLGNLVTATKTHATSYGLSPVSLLDAALSHVSASVTEIVKLLLIKRSPRDGGDDSTKGLSNGRYGGSLAAQNTGYSREPPRTQPLSFKQDNFNSRDPRSLRDRSEPSNSSASSPSALFDEAPRRRGLASDDMTTPIGGDAGDWTETKGYLEAQSEQLMPAIQGILGGVRNPNPSPELSEYITTVITIVSSIVAVARGALPRSAETRGNAILDTLSEHCDKLSEVQAQRAVTKDERQVMAQSSFAIANNVKELMKL